MEIQNTDVAKLKRDFTGGGLRIYRKLPNGSSHSRYSKLGQEDRLVYDV
jgi:hypothetical protein